MVRFSIEDDDTDNTDAPELVSDTSPSKRLTSTRFSLEDSVDEYCFEHRIPRVVPRPSTSLAKSVPPTSLRRPVVTTVVEYHKPPTAACEQIDRLSMLLDAALVISSRPIAPAPRPSTPLEPLLTAADRARIQLETTALKKESEARNIKNAAKIQALIDASLKAAEDAKLEHEKQEQARLLKVEQEQAAAEAKVDNKAPEPNPAEGDKIPAPASPPPPQREPEPSPPKKSSDFETKAAKIIQQLVQYRQSAETFADYPGNKQRRMGMKKLVIRSLNTLTQDDLAKNSTNSKALADAIIAAKTEDEQIKQQQPNVPEMARGKRFLINLLTSDVIKRAQAEGFNG